jgi:hypothetical protein
MAKLRSWAGLDVHAAKVVVCVVDAESGEMSVHRLPGTSRTPVGMSDRDTDRASAVRIGTYRGAPRRQRRWHASARVRRTTRERDGVDCGARGLQRKRYRGRSQTSNLSIEKRLGLPESLVGQRCPGKSAGCPASWLAAASRPPLDSDECA